MSKLSWQGLLSLLMSISLLALKKSVAFTLHRRGACRGELIKVSAISKRFKETTTLFEEVKVETKNGISFHDIKPTIQKLIDESGVKEGSVTVLSRHTTTAITINEMESRLVDDSRQATCRFTDKQLLLNIYFTSTCYSFSIRS